MKTNLTPIVLLLFLSFLTILSGQGQIISVSGNGHYGLKEQIIFQLQPEHVHGPTVVELVNGDLLTAWFQGSGERWADDVRIMGARRKAGTQTWSAPFLLADVAGFPDINPILFLDQQNRLWLMWYTVLANQWESSLLKYRISENPEGAAAPAWDWQDDLLMKPGDKTERGIQPGDRFVAAVHEQMTWYERYWEDTILSELPEAEAPEQRLAWETYKRKLDSLASGGNMLRAGRLRKNGQETSTDLGYPLARRLGWQTKNKPHLLGDRIIVPLYSDGLDCSIFAYTDDQGAHWKASNPVVGGIGIQPTILKKEDGTLVAYLRDNGPAPFRMQYTTSTDSAARWSIPRDATLPNPGAGFDGVTLRNGDWLLVYNDTEEGRHRLALALSEDEGQSWPWVRHLENDARGEQATQSHYPAIVEGSDGRIHIVYSYHHRDRGEDAKTIKYVSLDVDWVKEVVK